MSDPYRVGQTLYRAEATAMNYIDVGRRVYVTMKEYRVVKVTECGSWVDMGGSKKWVSLTTRWCSRSREEALGHLHARKKSHVKHARRRLRDAEAMLSHVEEMLGRGELPESMALKCIEL